MTFHSACDNKQDANYEHISTDEKQSISGECESSERWLHDQLAVQNELAQHEDPVLTVAMINDKRQVC